MMKRKKNNNEKTQYRKHIKGTISLPPMKYNFQKVEKMKKNQEFNMLHYLVEKYKTHLRILSALEKIVF